MNKLMRYDIFLKEREEKQGKISKGEKTKNRIKISIVKLLDRISYRDLRVVDICDQAGIAPGTFYIYFENSSVVVEQVLSEFIDMYFQHIAQIDNDDAFESINLANLAYLDNARINPGLMRCAIGMRIENPEFSNLHHEANNRIYRRIAKDVVKNRPELDFRTAFIAVHAMGSMMDDVASSIAFNKSLYLEEIIGMDDFSNDAYCECLSVIWFRTLYGKFPENVKSDLAKEFMRLGA